MAFTKEQIGNLALSHLGDARINGFDDNTKESETVKLWYDACRLETLEAFPWNFARRRETLAVHAIAAPTKVWAFRYRLPSDYAKARFIVNPAGRANPKVPYHLEIASDDSKSILTNQDEAELVYTYDTDNTGNFPVTYVVALSHLLAARMAIAITGKKSHQDAQYRLAAAAISNARTSVANESAEPPPNDADWIVARTGGTDFGSVAQVSAYNLPDADN